MILYYIMWCNGHLILLDRMKEVMTTSNHQYSGMMLTHSTLIHFTLLVFTGSVTRLDHWRQHSYQRVPLIALILILKMVWCCMSLYITGSSWACSLYCWHRQKNVRVDRIWSQPWWEEECHDICPREINCTCMTGELYFLILCRIILWRQSTRWLVSRASRKDKSQRTLTAFSECDK